MFAILVIVTSSLTRSGASPKSPRASSWTRSGKADGIDADLSEALRLGDRQKAPQDWRRTGFSAPCTARKFVRADATRPFDRLHQSSRHHHRVAIGHALRRPPPIHPDRRLRPGDAVPALIAPPRRASWCRRPASPFGRQGMMSSSPATEGSRHVAALCWWRCCRHSMLPFLALGGGAAVLAWKDGTATAPPGGERPPRPARTRSRSPHAPRKSRSTALKIDDLRSNGYALLPLGNGPDCTDP